MFHSISGARANSDREASGLAAGKPALGPLTSVRVWLDEDLSRAKMPASGLRESSRTSLPP